MQAATLFYCPGANVSSQLTASENNAYVQNMPRNDRSIFSWRWAQLTKEGYVIELFTKLAPSATIPAVVAAYINATAFRTRPNDPSPFPSPSNKVSPFHNRLRAQHIIREI